MKQKPRLVILGLVPFIIMVAAFQFVPILSMVTGSFQENGGHGFTFSQYTTLFTSVFYMQALKNSVIISSYSSLIAIVVGIISAYCITRFAPVVRDKLLMLSNMTSNFAGVPLAFAYIILLGNNGVFTLLSQRWGWDVLGDFNLYSWSGLVLIYVYFQVPLSLLLLYPSLYGIREQWKEAASLLGANTWQFWRTVGLPILAPSVFGTLGILFANSMGAYATTYALVGGNYNLLSTRIGSLVAGDVVNKPELGSALAVVLALTTLLAVFLNHKMAKRSELFSSTRVIKSSAKRVKRSSIRAELKGETG
ncbi:ABC transporter permease subunit [Paenibacillus peoriae]|uniref:ABC transporter permease n=1 Tax=Paenibacillus peoriae TaxID=59893 RepID=UPI00026C5B6C|nr:ABC transporter permease subunit [Paenibacillus peoriae]MEC0183185.1 ABC transporter permease subunit [Paenibacillus peoriae]